MTVVLLHSSLIHIDDDTGSSYTGLLVGDTFDNHRVSAPVLRQAAI